MSASITDDELALVCAGARIREVRDLGQRWLMTRGGLGPVLLLDDLLTDDERAVAYARALSALAAAR